MISFSKDSMLNPRSKGAYPPHLAPLPFRSPFRSPRLSDQFSVAVENLKPCNHNSQYEQRLTLSIPNKKSTGKILKAQEFGGEQVKIDFRFAITNRRKTKMI